jgi:selenocysteine lyase/cysteine desulfurase
MRAYENDLSRTLLDVLEEMLGVMFYGLTYQGHLNERVLAFSFTLKGWHPRRLSQTLDRQEIYVWDGNYYAQGVTECLGLEASGGVLRVGAVHYNTVP